MKWWTVPLLAVLAGALAIACGSPPPRPVDPRYAVVAEIHHARCGGCHRRVEPGTRTRAHLEKAFVRHRTRVHMTEAQWALMVDYLAAPASSASR